tara:strand:+ start:82 stop:447 length:366 start_codon:yes stop_codon:yes gene_type:complete
MGREHRSIAKKRYKSWKKARAGIAKAIENIDDELKLKLQIEEIFLKFDEDGSLGIDSKEMRKGMAEIGVTLTDAQAVLLVAEADADGDGYVQYEEFEFVIMNQINCFKNDNQSLCSSCSIC